MARFRYIQIDDEGIPYADSMLSGMIEDDHAIIVDQDFDITNKKYVDGEWVPYIPPENDELSEGEERQLEMQANIQYLVDLAEINEGSGI